jgi:hypothetical protein
MFDDVNQAIETYQSKWQALVAERKNKEFFERLKPTAIGWKVAGQAEYDRLFNQWREACDQIHIAWLNNRWLAAMHLRSEKLGSGIEIIKLMQRRPGSSDALGLDHMDFLDMEETNTKAILQEENIKWTEEENGMCTWTSLWFAGTEAKLRPHTVFDVAVAELQEISKRIRGGKFGLTNNEGTGPYLSEVE